MRRQKITAIALILILALTTVMFTACGKDGKQNVSAEPTGLSGEVKVAAYGVGCDIAENLGKDYKATNYKELKKMEKALKGGDFDLAILPTTAASYLYGKTDGGIVEMGPVSRNGIYVLSNEYNISSEKMSMFSGKTIYAAGSDSTEVKVFEYLMTQAGYGTGTYTLKILDSYGEVKKALKDYGNIALAAEPYVSSIMKSNDSVQKIMNLSKRWNLQTEQDVMTDVLIASSKFAKDRPDDMKIVISDVREAVDNTKSKADLVFYSRTNWGISMLKEFNAELYTNSSSVFGGKKIKNSLYYQM